MLDLSLFPLLVNGTTITLETWDSSLTLLFLLPLEVFCLFVCLF